MPKYIIEREIPAVGSLSVAQLQDVARNSCDALRRVGPQVQWVQSYFTRNKTYCFYIAPNKELIAEQARIAGIPANSISEVERIVDENTAKA